MANANNNIFGLKNLPKNSVPGPNVPLGNLLGDGPFDEAIFFDNEISHVMNLQQCPKIKSLKVAGKASNCLCVQSVDISSPEYNTYIHSLSEQGKKAANVIMRILLGRNHTTENLDIGSGIQLPEIEFLELWLSKRKEKKIAAFFDWDRTITTIEGGYYIGNTFQEVLLAMKNYKFPGQLNLEPLLGDLTLEGFVEYYVGGPERVRLLQKMFDNLYDSNVAVFLLTNNTACPSRKGLFKEMMGVLTRGRDVTVLCGYEFGFDKKLTIVSQSPTIPGGSLENLCKMAGGSRKRKRSQGKKKKKTLRKH